VTRQQPSMLHDDPGEAGERTMPTLLLLAEGDDVLIATRDLEPGIHRASTGEQVEVGEPVRLGHKVAARAIPIGQAVRRCGVPIGFTTVAVRPGSWVHTHNLASGYLATFARRGGE
jgi:SAF domain-containing protein